MADKDFFFLFPSVIDIPEKMSKILNTESISWSQLKVRTIIDEETKEPTTIILLSTFDTDAVV